MLEQLGQLLGIEAQANPVQPFNARDWASSTFQRITGQTPLSSAGQLSVSAHSLDAVGETDALPNGAPFFSLICIHSVEVDVSGLPPQRRRADIPMEEETFVGCEGQQDFFEAVLGTQITKAHIAQRHFKIIPKDDQPHVFEVTNLGPNPLFLGSCQLEKNSQSSIKLPERIDFAAESSGTAIIFLSVELRFIPATEEPSTSSISAFLKNRVPSRWSYHGKAHLVDTPSPSITEPSSPISRANMSTPVLLVCTSCLTCDIASMPLEARTIRIPSDGKIVIGRQLQPHFFKTLLGRNKLYMSSVSRSHFKIEPICGEPNVFEVTNLSQNPIRFGPTCLRNGCRASAKAPENIDFRIGDGLSEVTFLRLTLESGPNLSTTEALANTLSLPCQSAAPLGSGSNFGSQGKVSDVNLAHLTPGAFWLSLGGSLVRDDIPSKRLLLHGSEHGLIVGRTHQNALHSEAIHEDALSYIGREHFRVECTWRKTWKLVPNKRHLMWREHKGNRTEATCILPLMHGDSILIYTGASDRSPDGPGCLGTLHWTFLCHKEKAGKSDGKEHDIPENEGLEKEPTFTRWGSLPVPCKGKRVGSAIFRKVTVRGKSFDDEAESIDIEENLDKNGFGFRFPWAWGSI